MGEARVNLGSMNLLYTPRTMQCKTIAMSAKLTFFRESFHKEFQISFLEASLIYYSKAKKLGPSKCLSQILHILPITLVNSFLLKIHKIC